MRSIGRYASVLIALLLAVRPGQARVTLLEGDKGKLEMEIRLMFWAVAAGPEDLYTGSASPSPQDEGLRDFFLRRARLLFRAQISPNLEIFTQFGQDNTASKILKDDAGLRIKDFGLNYRKNDGLQVVVGQFKVPFLRQNLESGFNQLLVDRAALPGQRPAVEGQRDDGGMVWGNRGGFQYRVALFDGADQEDSNSGGSLRPAARFSYNWFTPEPGFAYTGTTVGEKRILQVGAQIDAQRHRLDGKDETGFTILPRDYRAAAADLFLDQPFGGGWAATFEGAWLNRRDDYEDPAVETRTLDGFYAQAGLLLPGHVGPGRLQFVMRYEDLDQSRGTARSSATNRTAGLTWFGKGHDRKIQADYTDRRERPTDRDDNELRLSVIAVF